MTDHNREEREALIERGLEALTDDAWVGHSDELTRDDLAMIVQRVWTVFEQAHTPTSDGEPCYDLDGAVKHEAHLSVTFTSDEREALALIEKAAEAIAFTTEHPGLGHVDWPDQFDAIEIAKACLAVFEQAHTPTSDEREALLAEADRWPSGLPDDPTPAASPHDLIARLAAALRRTVQGEPSDAQVLAGLNAQYAMERSQARFPLGVDAEHLSDYSPQAEARMRAVLRAAAAVREEGRGR